MDLQQRTLRVGLTAILCAAVFRLCSLDISQEFSRLGGSPYVKRIQAYFETGQDVRFSPSLETFSPQFVETPPPVPGADPEPALPLFSDTELVEVFYSSSVKPSLDTLIAKPLQWSLYGEAPTVLILHTHATESYTQRGEGYRETSAYRTLEESYNMLAIGELMAQLLNRQGIPTIQDRQLHDYPSYNGSYTHARKTIREYLERYPSIRLILDLHRDASDGSGGQLRTVAYVDETASAQLMVVIGTNHPGYEENLSLGLKLHAQLETQSPGITRPLQLRAQRFNQDLLPGTLLIEVGAAGNSHAEARLAARQLAQAVIALAGGTAEPEKATE